MYRLPFRYITSVPAIPQRHYEKDEMDRQLGLRDDEKDLRWFVAPEDILCGGCSLEGKGHIISLPDP